MQVIYKDHMGDDAMVVNSARVSFRKEVAEFDADRDTKLVQYLADHGHWTPFSHPQITMVERVPIFVARQRFKHMVGFTYNEVSRRYVDDQPEFWTPDTWRGRPEGSMKQGSTGELEFFPSEQASMAYDLAITHCEEAYKEMLGYGVAPEQARAVLPQSMYTEYYVTGSLAAWARAYRQRADVHAQVEIQELAKMWDDVIAPLFPVSWKALTQRG